MFKGIANLASMIKNARQIGGKMREATEALKSQRAKGTAGGGMVEIEVNGLQEVLACRIDPNLLEQNDRELLEDLITAAANQALTQARQLYAEAMRAAAGGLNIPGLEDTLSETLGQDESGKD